MVSVAVQGVRAQLDAVAHPCGHAAAGQQAAGSKERQRVAVQGSEEDRRGGLDRQDDRREPKDTGREACGGTNAGDE